MYSVKNMSDSFTNLYVMWLLYLALSLDLTGFYIVLFSSVLSSITCFFFITLGILLLIELSIFDFAYTRLKSITSIYLYYNYCRLMNSILSLFMRSVRHSCQCLILLYMVDLCLVLYCLWWWIPNFLRKIVVP